MQSRQTRSMLTMLVMFALVGSTFGMTYVSNLERCRDTVLFVEDRVNAVRKTVGYCLYSPVPPALGRVLAVLKLTSLPITSAAVGPLYVPAPQCNFVEKCNDSVKRFLGSIAEPKVVSRTLQLFDRMRVINLRCTQFVVFLDVIRYVLQYID